MTEAGESGPAAPEAAGRTGLIDRAFATLSLIGGLSLLGLGLLVTVSVLSRWLGFGGVAGDFEIVQMLTALGVFAFLPLCQLRRGHIFVDTFTGRLPAGLRGGLDAMWDLLALGAFAFIAWRLTMGAQDAIASQTVTMVLSFPSGWVILGCAALSALSAAAAAIAARRVLAR